MGTKTDHPPTPVWCGRCDARTRLLDHGASVSRCRQCHPLMVEMTHIPWCGKCDNRTRFAYDPYTHLRKACYRCNPAGKR